MSDVPPEVARLAEQREDARRGKDFSRADDLRARIEEAGFEVADTPDGPVLTPKAPFQTVDPRAVRDSLGDEPDLDLSLHVLYEGHLDDLSRFVRGVVANATEAATEVVVVDNDSGDGEAIEAAVEGADQVRVLHLAPRAPWAVARNAGMRTSRGRIIALADLSVEATGDIAGPLLAAFDDPAVGVAGPFGLTTQDMRDFADAPGPSAHAIEGYLLATRRSLLARAGLLDERFTWYRNADIELSFRLRAEGHEARVVPLPVVKHAHRGWTSVPERERATRSRKNHALFLERWRDRTDLIS